MLSSYSQFNCKHLFPKKSACGQQQLSISFYLLSHRGNPTPTFAQSRAAQTRSFLLYFQNLTTLRRSQLREEGREKPRLALFLMLQVTHFASLKKIVLTAGLPDLFHHRLNPKPGISWNFSTNYCCGVCKALYPSLTILLLHSKDLLGQQQVSRFFFCCMFAPDQNNTLIIVTLVLSQRHAVLFTAVLCVWMQPPLTFKCVSATKTNSL